MAVVETKRPNYIEVSDHFYQDSSDFLKRYKLCMETEFPDFSSLKSRRMKCFIDLRMAMESALKSIVAYYEYSDLCGETLVRKIEGFRHHLRKLIGIAINYIPENLKAAAKELCGEIDRLPVGLRYRLGVMDFISNQNEKYYSTIGNDKWLFNSYSTISELSKFIGNEISKNSGFISLEELAERMLEPSFEKYETG